MSKIARGEALQGYACRYRQAFLGKHGLGVLMPGCFTNSLRNGGEIPFLLQHEDNQPIGSTVAALTFHDDPANGLAFRLENPPVAVRDVVKAGLFRNMSVGFAYTSAETKRIDGDEVSLIHEAELREISLVHRGAIGNTGITVVNLAQVGTLKDAADNGALALRGAFAAYLNALDDTLDDVGATIADAQDELVEATDWLRSAAARSRNSHRKRKVVPLDLSFARNSFMFTERAQALIAAPGGADAIRNHIGKYARQGHAL